MRNMAWCSSCLNTGRGRDHKRASAYGGRSHPEVNDNLDTTRVCLQIQGQRLPALVRFGSLWDQLPTVQLPNNPVSLGTRSQKGRGSLKVSMEFGNNGKLLIWQHASFTNGGGCFFECFHCRLSHNGWSKKALLQLVWVLWHTRGLRFNHCAVCALGQ